MRRMNTRCLSLLLGLLSFGANVSRALGLEMARCRLCGACAVEHASRLLAALQRARRSRRMAVDVLGVVRLRLRLRLRARSAACLGLHTTLIARMRWDSSRYRT